MAESCVHASVKNTGCFNSNRKPNPWWQNSRWSPPSFLAMLSLRFPAGCWTGLLRTRRLGFRCRFQVQLSSPTSPCKWHAGPRPLQWRALVSGWAWDDVRASAWGGLYSRGWYRDRGWSSFSPFLLPSLPAILASSLLSSVLWFRSPSVPFFLSYSPTDECPLWVPGSLQSDWCTSMENTTSFCSRISSGENQ